MVKNYFVFLLLIFLFVSMKVEAQERRLWTQTGLNRVENLNSEIAMNNKFIQPNQFLRLILKV